jgi:tetratricopeptide (TPR) repeat protein
MNLFKSVFVFSISIFLTCNGLIAQKSGVHDLEPFKNLNQNAKYDTLLALSRYYSFDFPDTALYFSLKAFELAQTQSNESRISESAYWTAEALTNGSKFKEAIDYYRISADAEYRIRKDSTGYFAERLSDIAFCYQELGIYEKSLELYKHALRIQKKLNNLEEIGNIQSNIGSNYFYQGKYDKSLEYFESTLQIDRQRNDSSALSATLNNIGMLYSRWGKMEQSIRFYEESLLYTQNELKKSIRYSNIGTCYFHLGSPEKALEYLNIALELDRKNNQQVKIAIRKNEIANVLANIGEERKAIAFQKEALMVFRELEIKESEAITLTDLGDIYKKTSQIDSAETCYLKSIAIAREINALHHLIRNYKSLFELYEGKGENKKALDYFKMYATLNDSVYNEEKHEQLARFEILFESEKKEKENQMLSKDLEGSRKMQRMSWIIISFLVFIAILLLYLFRFKSKLLKQNQKLLAQEHELVRLEHEKGEAGKQMLEDRIFAEQQINRLEREKLKAEINHKNRELANATLCLVSKNEILVEIRDKIKNENKSESMTEVVRFINSNTDVDQNWKKFKLEFDKIHPGFFDRLRNQFPNLTEHDYRMCTYLRINVSSREIAGIMNISVDAVSKNRQRLRKRLNLEPEANLTQFLEHI